jgi:hypothetical protein
VISVETYHIRGNVHTTATIRVTMMSSFSAAVIVQAQSRVDCDVRTCSDTLQPVTRSFGVVGAIELRWTWASCIPTIAQHVLTDALRRELREGALEVVCT